LRAPAKQSSCATARRLDCFVAIAPRNDDGKSRRASPLRGVDRPRFCQSLSPSSNRGRGECRVPNAPAAWCAHIGSESMHTSIHSGSTGIARHPPRSGVTASFALSRGPLELLTPSVRKCRASQPGWAPRDCIRTLTPTMGRQNHATSPSATLPLVSHTTITHEPGCPAITCAHDSVASTAPRPAPPRPTSGDDWPHAPLHRGGMER